MSIQIRPFDDSLSTPWDQWCEAAINATALHTRRFLSYHNDRFVDRSLMLYDGDHLVGVLPAAHRPGHPDLVVSHPGATYGGIVHDGWLTGGRMVQAMQAVMEHYQQAGHRTFRYKPLPHIYARAPAQDDLYALFRCASRIGRCDLSCCIDLQHPGQRSERRARSLRKAQRLGVTTREDIAALPEFWRILQDNLAHKHAAAPVHSLPEITLLSSRFPQQIRLIGAWLGDELVSGTLIFANAMVWHAQYIASSDAGYKSHGLDVVFDNAIAAATAQGARYFDFGTSNESEGTVLNDTLYRFKAEFGASGVAYPHHDIDL